MNINKFLSERSLAWFLRVGATVSAVILLILFCVARGEQLSNGGANTASYVWLIILDILGVIVLAASLVDKLWYLKYAALPLYLVCCIIFLNTEMVFITQVLLGIDEISFGGAFIATIVFWIITVILCIATIVFWIITVILCIATMVMYERKRSIRLAEHTA